jgi:hypothetical protein
MAYVYHEFAFQRTRFRAVYRGIPGLGLIAVYVYYEFPKYDVSGWSKGSTRFRIDNGVCLL